MGCQRTLHWAYLFKVRNVDVAPVNVAIAAGCQRGGIDGLPEDVALGVLVQSLLCLDPLGQGGRLLPTSEVASVLHVSNFLAEAGELSIHPGLALLSRVAPVAGIGAGPLTKLAGHGVVDPADTLGHRGVDTRGVVLTTSDTPSNDASLDVRCWVELALADKRAASISLASVLAINSASADERVIKLEPLAKPGGPEGGLALVVADNWQVDLLENNLVIAGGSELILSPSCGEACLEVKQFLWLGKADCINVGLKVKVLRSVENCPVVGEVPWVELRVDVQGLNVSVLVGPGLCLVLGVPFSASDLQLGWFLLELGSTVGSSEDDTRGDQGA